MSMNDRDMFSCVPNTCVHVAKFGFRFIPKKEEAKRHKRGQEKRVQKVLDGQGKSSWCSQCRTAHSEISPQGEAPTLVRDAKLVTGSDSRY